MEEGGTVRVCCHWPLVALGPVCSHQPLALVPLQTCCSDSFNIAASPRNQEKRPGDSRAQGRAHCPRSVAPAARPGDGWSEPTRSASQRARGASLALGVWFFPFFFLQSSLMRSSLWAEMPEEQGGRGTGKWKRQRAVLL